MILTMLFLTAYQLQFEAIVSSSLCCCILADVLQIDVSFICICLVIDHEFCHNNVKVAVDPLSYCLMDPQLP